MAKSVNTRTSDGLRKSLEARYPDAAKEELDKVIRDRDQTKKLRELAVSNPLK